jgi:hypothetical protein
VICSSSLNRDLSKRINTIATYLHRVLTAVELSGSKGNSKEAIDDTYRSLHEVCEKSIRLAIRMRGSRSNYALEVPKDCTCLAQYDESFYIVRGTEGQISEPLDPRRAQIFCTEFGGLVKTKDIASDEGEKLVVLCPAQVIVYEEDSGSHHRGSRQ